MATLTRRRALALAIGSLAILASGPALAAEVELSATFSRDSAVVGEGVVLEIEVGVIGNERVGAPRFANVDGLTIQNRGTSSGVTMQFGGGTGSSQTTKVYSYLVTANQSGEFELDIVVDVGGTKYTPKFKPKLSVTGESLPDDPDDPVDPQAGAAPTLATDDIMVWPVVDTKQVWVGQQIIYELQLWSRVFSRLELTKLPTFKDFWTEELEVAQDKRRAVVEGLPYDVFTFMRRAVFPQKPGTLTIGGANVRSGGSVGFFGGSTTSREHVGRDFTITVKPLPTTGQPANFSANNVGEFTVSAKVDRTVVRQGEALRLSVTVSGSGNIALVNLGELPKPTGMRAYESRPEAPKLDNKGASLRGERTWTMLVVAETAGTMTIPVIELAYFDPKQGRYAIAKTKPITIEVEANPDAAPAPVDEPIEQIQAREDLAPPVAATVLSRAEFRKPWLTPNRWWMGIATVPAILGLAGLTRWAGQRLGPSERARSRSAEIGRRRRLLARARGGIETGEGFHATLGELLHKVAVDRAGSAGTGLARAPLMATLRTQGLAAEDVAQMESLLDACDAARYGAGAGDLTSRREQFDQAGRLLDNKSWRANG